MHARRGGGSRAASGRRASWWCCRMRFSRNLRHRNQPGRDGAGRAAANGSSNNCSAARPWWWCSMDFRTPATPAPSCAPPKPSAPPEPCSSKARRARYNPKTLRASAGSLFRVPFLHGMDHRHAPAPRCEQNGVNLYAAMPANATAAATSLTADADLTGRCALIIGSEARGVSRRMAHGGGRRLHPHRGRGIAERRHRRRHPALRSAAAEDAAAVSLFDSTPPDAPARPAAASGRSPSACVPQQPGRLRRAGAHSRPRQAAAPPDRTRRADLDHPLGTARRRQDHAGARSSRASRAASSSRSARSSAASRKSKR